MSDKQELKIAGLMTAGRYENTFARNHIDAAFVGAKIPLQVSQGVFYGQCMQRMMELNIENGVDIAVCVDGDSLFTSQDIMRVVKNLVSYKEVDAIAAMQVRRGQQTLLGSKDKEHKLQVGSEPVQVSTAHFGLTAIDLRRMKDVPKPWFASSPCEDGSWGDARVDDDIWFWRQWQKAGRTVYLDPQTCIGHLEEMVVIPDEKTFEAQHIYPNDWISACT